MIDHVAVNVSNIEDSVNWYLKNLNAKIEYVDETWAMLNINGSKIALILKEEHPPHIAIKVSPDELKSAAKNSKIKTHRDGSSYVYLKDLDSNHIEYICYDFDE